MKEVKQLICIWYLSDISIF